MTACCPTFGGQLYRFISWLRCALQHRSTAQKVPAKVSEELRTSRPHGVKRRAMIWGERLAKRAMAWRNCPLLISYPSLTDAVCSFRFAACRALVVTWVAYTVIPAKRGSCTP